MQSVSMRGPHHLRRLATELRDDASRATMPGYALKMIHAADDLERRATELEILRVMRDTPAQVTV